jgi:hypothetical protein
MDKNVLIVGGGSKVGLETTRNFLQREYTVNLISSKLLEPDNNLNQLQVDWNTLKISDLELFLKKLPMQQILLFNQNASALSDKCYNIKSFDKLDLWRQEKHWSQAYFVSCILPFHIIHSLGKNCNEATKIGWMLSSLILKHDSKQIQFSDYIGNKFVNYLLIKNFSTHHESCFFVINPDSLNDTGTPENISKFLDFVIGADTKKLNGKIFKLSCVEDINFKQFDDE